MTRSDEPFWAPARRSAVNVTRLVRHLGAIGWRLGSSAERGKEKLLCQRLTLD